MDVAGAVVAAGVVPIRHFRPGTATREGTTPVDRTGVVDEVVSVAVEVAVGAVGTTGTRRRTLHSFPTCEGINARYVQVGSRVSLGEGVSSLCQSHWSGLSHWLAVALARCRIGSLSHWLAVGLARCRIGSLSDWLAASVAGPYLRVVLLDPSLAYPTQAYLHRVPFDVSHPGDVRGDGLHE